MTTDVQECAKLHVYVATFGGVLAYGVAVVVAANETDAETMVRNKLASETWDCSRLGHDLRVKRLPTEPGVHYYNNGEDY